MHFKKIICMLLICVLSLSIDLPISANKNITVLFEGRRVFFDVLPQTINGRTMVPIRSIFETMGATVKWDDSTQSAICTKGDTMVKMTLNSTVIYINNHPHKMDIAPVMINNRILAPARYVAESFGYTVDWNENTSTVSIHQSEEKYSIAPEYITDFTAEYIEETNMYNVFFGFKNNSDEYVTYDGTAKINIINDNLENVYSKEFSVYDSMYGTYTKTFTGDQKYILCEINIPISEIKKGKTEKGFISLDFYNGNISYGTLKDTCYDLPVLSGNELAQIDYEKSFILTNKLSSGKTYRKTVISSFEITDIELDYLDELKISYQVTGVISGESNYCHFQAKCYDKDGYIIDTFTIHMQVTTYEPFKFNDVAYIPSETVKIEFEDM